MDLPDIEIIVQFKATCTLCTLWQRFGCAARGSGYQATAILLVEKKHLRPQGGTDSRPGIRTSTPVAMQSNEKKRKRTGDSIHPPSAKWPALSDKPINVLNHQHQLVVPPAAVDVDDEHVKGERAEDNQMSLPHFNECLEHEGAARPIGSSATSGPESHSGDLIAECRRRYAQVEAVGRGTKPKGKGNGVSKKSAMEEGSPMDDYINVPHPFDCWRVVLRTYFESDKACT